MGKKGKKRVQNAVQGTSTNMWEKFHWNSVDDSAEFGDNDGDKQIEDSMFFGLEELDSSSYKVAKSKSGGLKVLALSAEESAKKKKKNKRQKKDKKNEGKGEQAVESGDDEDEEVDLKRKQKRKDKVGGVKSSSQLSDLAKYTNVPPAAYSAWCSVKLHKELTDSLTELGFDTPTSIQSSSIPVINEGNSDVVGAAETGSGKTLAFSVPIVNSLLVDWVSVTTARIKEGVLCPYAMIIVPTRELAMQISSVIKEVTTAFRGTYRVEVVTIVGGMSEQKQRRQLDGKTPVHIIVATPGRLCELMEDETLSIFRDMAHLRYLVVDEADRIVEEGHFAEVHRIFSRIKDHEQLAVEGESEADGGDEGKGGSGGGTTDYGMDIDEELIGRLDHEEVPLSALPEMPSEEAIERARREQTDKPYDEQGTDEDDAEGDAEGDTKEETAESGGIVGKSYSNRRQTLLFSATALRIQGLKQIHNEGRKGGKKTKKKLPPLPGLTAEMSEQLPEHVHQLMRLVGRRPRVDVVDVTGDRGINTVPVKKDKGSVQGKRDGVGGGGRGGNNEDENENEDEESDVAANAVLARNLPKQLVHLQINTPAEDKDIYAYYYLQANANKRVLIFVNSIKTSRRLDGLLRALNLNCRVIHAQLQQKQRIKALESFQQSPSGVLVATDVAARGLDIPNVDTVLHYDVARSSQVYIHRSGRTARANRAGTSISLVAPEDHLHHVAIVDILGSASQRRGEQKGGATGASSKLASKADKLRAKLGGLQEFSVDSAAMTLLRKRCVLAKKIFLQSFLQGQEQKDSTWLKQTSVAAGIDVDDDLASELVQSGSSFGTTAAGRASKGKTGGAEAKRMTKKELDRLRWDLKQLLATPVASSTAGIGARKKGFFVVGGGL